MKNASYLVPIILLLGYLFYEHVYKAPKYNSGEPVDQIEAVLIDGTTFTLSDLLGKYVLVDFWGSWCPPCRIENPELVQLYHSTREQSFAKADGFEILSIGIESSESSWKKAIERDRLTWKYHIIQKERFMSPLAKLYSVKEIPTKYLLDTNGIVLLVNPTFGEIYDYLNQG